MWDDIEIKQYMADYCRQLGNNEIEPRIITNGLCFNFKVEFDEHLEHLIDFAKYPNFSGHEGYPIKSFNDERGPYEKFISWPTNKWDRRTNYGKERYKFCLWCADELERLMNKQEHRK